MERLRKFAVVMAAVTVIGGVAAGCSDSDSDEATTPADATTIANTAVQTDSEGNTEATDTAPPADDGATDDEPAPAAGGDATAGLATFEAVCQGCHANGGQEPGVGPKLAEAGLTEDGVKEVITNGQGTMPAGLVSGEDLDNVAAYVVSIQ